MSYFKTFYKDGYCEFIYAFGAEDVLAVQVMKNAKKIHRPQVKINHNKAINSLNRDDQPSRLS